MINARRKGVSFEQKVAARLRIAWPHFTVRRSQQAHQAYEPDVVVDGVTAPDIWIECHHGRTDPRKKYEQAMRDVKKANVKSTPVVIFQPPRSRRWFVMVQAFPADDYSEQQLDRIGDSSAILGIFDFEEWLNEVGA